MAVKKKAYVFPKNIGKCLARLAALEKAIALAQVKVAPLSEEETALRDFLLNKFKKDELNGAKGSGLSLSVVRSVVPTLKDWKKFFKFAMKPGNDDLLQRSVNTPAWRARMEANKPVPGVDTFGRVSLRVTKDTKGD